MGELTDLRDKITRYYQFRDTDDTTILQAYSTTATFFCTITGCNREDTIYCHAKNYDGFDYTIDNNDSFQNLYKQIDEIMEEILND